MRDRIVILRAIGVAAQNEWKACSTGNIAPKICDELRKSRRIGVLREAVLTVILALMPQDAFEHSTSRRHAQSCGNTRDGLRVFGVTLIPVVEIKTGAAFCYADEAKRDTWVGGAVIDGKLAREAKVRVGRTRGLPWAMIETFSNSTPCV